MTERGKIMEFELTKEIQTEYHNLLKIQKKKVIKKLLYLSSFLVIPIVIFFILYDSGVLFLVLFFVSLGIYIGSLISILIAQFIYVSENPFYEYFYPKVIEELNENELVSFTYEAYPKHKEDFHTSNLYPFLSTKTVYGLIGFQSKHQYDVTVCDVHIHNAGQRRVTYLNGYYFVIKGFIAPIFQLRTNHSPYGRTKYKRLPLITLTRAYVAATDDNPDPAYLRVYSQIKDAFESPNVEMSSTGTELHIGITLKPIQRRIRKLDAFSFHKTRSMIMQIFDIANLFKNENKKKEKKK